MNRAVMIDDMPRGGPDASWLDRRLQTDRLEYTDRTDVPDAVKQRVIQSLERAGQRCGHNDKLARLAISLMGEHARPRILELGAGHGRLSEKILELHPQALVTASDLDPTSVTNMARGALGSHPRADTRVFDATHIDAPDASYELVILSVAFHHLRPQQARKAIIEATRVGKRFLVIDAIRPRPLVLSLLAATSAAAYAALWPIASLRPGLHDGLISVLRSYSRDAFVALAHAAHPFMAINFVPTGIAFPPLTGVVISRPPDQL